MSVPQDRNLSGTGRYRWWHFDMEDPSFADWAGAHLPQVPAGALLQPETRPRCDRYEAGLILNLRGINLNEGQAADQMVSLRMWVAEDVIVSVRRRRVFALDEIRRAVAAQDAPANPAAFLERLVAGLTARIEDEVALLAQETEDFEARLEDPSVPLPKELPVSRRRVVRLRRYLEPQRAALHKLAALDTALMPQEDALRLRELANRTTIAVEELEALREQLMAVQDEHDLHIARKQASHGYILSLAAGIFLPLGFLTGLFGVNVAGVPGLSNPWAFAILCLAMAGLAGLLLVILKLTRWL